MRKIRHRSVKKRRPWFAVIVILLVFLIIGLACFYVVAEAGSDKILRNIYVDGIRIGGMKIDEAQSILEDAFSQRRITIRLDEENQREFTFEELGLMYKTDVIVGEAYGVGKSKRFGKNVYQILASFFSPTRISSSEALVSMEPGSDLMEYIESYRVMPTESTYDITGDRVKVVNGMNGREVDAEKLISEIVNAGSYEDTEAIDAPINILPFTLLNVDDIYRSTASNPHAPYGRNSDGDVTATVKAFNLDIARETQRNNSLEGEAYEFIIDSESVVALDDEDLYPDIVGEKTTQFDTGYTTRAHNIRLAVSFLNGAEILPGEVFSFNNYMGESTVAKGYQVAKGYASGTVVDSVGAGICQVSSTLYNAALGANLEIVKRSNHSLPVAYLPLGQDAAISYPTQDFRFKNNTSFPIKIVAQVDGGNLYVKILGQKSDTFTDVKIINNTLSVIEPKTREVVDESLTPGKRVTAQSGANGYVVESFRVVYKDGVEIKRENLGKSTYMAQDKIIKIGPKE